jgi:hypothetical protein
MIGYKKPAEAGCNGVFNTEKNMDSDQSQPLASHWKSEVAGLVPVNGLSGFKAVFLYVIDDMRCAVDREMVLELGDFLNRNLAPCDSLGADNSGDLMGCADVHDDVLADWHLNNFFRFVKEKKFTPNEVKFMTSLAVSAVNLVRLNR